MDDKNKDIIENNDTNKEENLTDNFLSGNMEESKRTENINNIQDENELDNKLNEENHVDNFTESNNYENIENNKEVEDLNYTRNTVDMNKSENFNKDNNDQSFNASNDQNTSRESETRNSNEFSEKANEFIKSTKPVFSEIFEKFKMWFSNDPFKVFSSKLSKSATFTILGINILVSMITLMLNANSFTSVFLPYYFDVNFSVFVIGLLLNVSFYALLALTFKFIATYLKGPKLGFMSSLELIALVTIPSFCISLVGLLLGTLFTPILILTRLVIFIINIVAYYVGIRKYLGVERPTFWAFIVGLSVFAIVIMILFINVFKLIINNMIYSNFPF